MAAGDESPRILIVDDDPQMLRAMGRILNPEYEVRVCSSGKLAIETAGRFRPDLAVVDIRMPDLDGFQVMAELKELDADLKVILVTGSVYESDQKLIRAIQEEAFYFILKPFDREVLRTLVRRCLQLRTLELADRNHRENLESELRAAAAFQKTMLPASSASVAGLHIRAAYRPCEDLAGDLYDYAALADEGVAVLVADVAGHGASAAMLTSAVKAAFRASHTDNYAPLKVVQRVAQSIAAFEASRFVTLICARISLSAGSLEVVNAGHEGGMVVDGQGEISDLPSTGPLISSVIPGLAWQQQTFPWSPDTKLVLFTDGITERWNVSEMFGAARLKRLIQQYHPDGDTLVRQVLEATEDFASPRRAEDDMTILCVSL